MRTPRPALVVALVAVILLSGCHHDPAPAGSQPSSRPVSTIAVHDAVFASPTGAFVCALSDGVADCLWPRGTPGPAAPRVDCSPAADEGPELRPGHPPARLCGTDVGVVASTDTITWAPPGTATVRAPHGLATPELTDGVTLTSGATRCRGAGTGVRCTSSGGWFVLAPGSFRSGRGGGWSGLRDASRRWSRGHRADGPPPRSS